MIYSLPSGLAVLLAVGLILIALKAKNILLRIVLVIIALAVAFFAILFFVAATMPVCDPVHPLNGPVVCDPVHPVSG